MTILLTTVFVASLLGSLHCVGMCGPFALLASVDPHRRVAAMAPTFAYSVGRLLTYSMVGMLFGALGMALNHGGESIAPWQQSATYVAGVLMIVVGVISLLRYFGVQARLPGSVAPLQKLVQWGFGAATNLTPVPRALAIGAITSLMPCGWLYTFAITAAGTGSPLWGLILMATFWAGTVPVMTALMLGSCHLGKSIQRQLPMIMAILVVMLGAFTILFRAPVAIGAETNVVTGAANLTEQVSTIDHAELPCCQCESGQP